MLRFLMFYAFWHCICLAAAELWGYPDRDFYGPWWLVTDDLRLMFRMWSTPVHRWLAACIYRPILQLGAGMKHGPSKINGSPMASHSSRVVPIPSLHTAEDEKKTKKRDGDVECKRDGRMSKR
ncbi:unnamed protein product [Sphacelaria rigidula]